MNGAFIGRNRLRFGIMCSGTRFQAWQAEGLRRILELRDVEPALLIIDEDASGHGWLRKNLAKMKKPSRALWYLYSLADRGMSRAKRTVSMDEQLAGVPVLRCRVRRKGKYSEYFSGDDVSKVRECNLDFIIRFGFNIIRGEILEASRYGVWSFHHDDEEKYRGSPPGFWEIYNGDSVSGAILQRLTGSLDAGIVLKKGYSKTVRTSYTRNRDKIFFDSTVWPAQVCVDILNGRGGYLDSPPSRTNAPISKAPGNVQMLIFFFRILRNTVVDVSRKMFLADRWNVGIVPAPVTDFLEEGFSPDVRWLRPPGRSKFFADPFAVRRGDAVFILLEDYDYYSSRGRVSSVLVTGSGVSEPEPVLEKNLHLSHPYMVESGGKIYCIPETCDEEKVVLYEAQDFPAVWRIVTTLIGGFAGVDNTVFEFGGLWWLFATDQNDGPNHKLRIWFAPEIKGPWSRHALDPAKIDIRSSRPAGTPFFHGGSLIRPAQDCSLTYGGRIILNRILKLTPYEFEEEPAGFINPCKIGPYTDGLHTICGVGNLTVLDGKKHVFVGYDPSIVAHKLRRMLTGGGH